MATGKLVGTDTAYSTNGAGPYAVWVKFTVDSTGTLSEVRVYSVTNGNVKVGVYADSAGVPGSRLAKQDTGTAVTASAWTTITLEASLNITAGQIIWLSFIGDCDGAVACNPTGGTSAYVSATYSTWAWPNPAPSTISQPNYVRSIAGWGVLVLSPSGISQVTALGAPKLNFILYPSGIEQAVALGEPAVQLAGTYLQPPGIAQLVTLGTPEVIKLLQFIAPTGIAQPIVIGTPALIYPQTLSPQGIAQAIVFGTPSVSIYGFIGPSGIAQLVAIGSPTLLKYVWHVILDGQYLTETPDINRAYVIGRDANGNPIYGEAMDSTELALVGERLDFIPDPAIPTTAQAGDVASAILAKMRLTGKRGVILIPPNCGQELFDVVQISDAGANQSAVSFRVVGIRFEYNPKQARYDHKLILGAP